MRGDVDPFRLNIQSALFLANQMVLYYADDERFNLVKKFNDDPANFDFNVLLEFKA